ncbi:MAG: hypothetical protein JRI23_29475, partial [Deltaproteobacteria bacterium]|nr:hypothetical protein [Deltaproteobacteria bacterium]MBW2536284.1 hypothetical protein [Deltaproteobacteria bacterium]
MVSSWPARVIAVGAGLGLFLGLFGQLALELWATSTLATTSIQRAAAVLFTALGWGVLAATLGFATRGLLRWR